MPFDSTSFVMGQASSKFDPIVVAQAVQDWLDDHPEAVIVYPIIDGTTIKWSNQ